MTLLDDVVVVRNVAVAGVLQAGAARGQPTGEPGGVEPELEPAALRRHRLDVSEEHLLAARLGRGLAVDDAAGDAAQMRDDAKAAAPTIATTARTMSVSFFMSPPSLLWLLPSLRRPRNDRVTVA